MFALVRMQFHNHVDTQSVKRFKRAVRFLYDMKFGMLLWPVNLWPLSSFGKELASQLWLFAWNLALSS